MLPVDGPILLDLDGDEFLVQPGSFAWMRAAEAGDMWAIFPGSQSLEEVAYIAQRLDDPDDWLDTETLLRAAEYLIETACGMKWWRALRLLASAAASWTVLDAYAFTQGVDLRGAPVSRLCNATWSLLCNGAQKDLDRKTLEFKLNVPPKGVEHWKPEDEAQNFAKLLASQGRSRGAAPAETQAPASS